MVIGQVERHFDSIDDALDFFRQDLVGEELRNDFKMDDVDYLWTRSGTLTPSITSSFASPYLYRGQTIRHQPCLPAVFRGLSPGDHPNRLPPAERARLLIDRVRAEEFIAALEAHPSSDYAREIGLRPRPYAMAQHYELATDRIDLTQDHAVAAFFATHTCESGIWQPVKGGEGAPVGVLYRLHTTSFYRHFKEQLESIGKQVWPRPAEQRAYTLALPLGLDFEALPIETFTFDQNETCGRKLSERFEGGAALFPPDAMAEVARRIRSSSTLPLSMLAKALGAGLESGASASGVSQAAGFIEAHSALRVCHRDLIGLTAVQRDEANAAVEVLRSTFLRRTGGLAVRRV